MTPLGSTAARPVGQREPEPGPGDAPQGGHRHERALRRRGGNRLGGDGLHLRAAHPLQKAANLRLKEDRQHHNAPLHHPVQQPALLQLQLTDILDIAILSFVIYKLLWMLRKTSSGRVLRGLLILGLAMALSSSNFLGLTATSW